MARKRRLHIPQAIYHIILRGNDKQPIFFSNLDRLIMCDLLKDGLEKFGHLIHAFCFMNNHIHLAIQVGEVSISKIIHNLAFRYAQHINETQERVGHLFQNRFKSILIDSDGYLLELIRYIHLNPVRASIVKSPEEYIWSSHKAYLQMNDIPWLTKDNVLRRFGNTHKDAIKKYNKFILAGVGIKSDLMFESGLQDGILGSEKFIESVLERCEKKKIKQIELEDLIKKVCEKYEISPSKLPDKNRRYTHVRAILSYLVNQSDNLALVELARFLNREPSGLSKLARKFENNCSTQDNISEEIKDIIDFVMNSK